MRLKEDKKLKDLLIEELTKEDEQQIKRMVTRMLKDLFRVLYAKPGFWSKDI